MRALVSFPKLSGGRMAQAKSLNDAEIKRVFRIIDTTKYAERNRLIFSLSIYAGMRVGEIA